MKVLIVQPAIPHYRRPLFSGLAQQKDIELRVAAPLEPMDTYPETEELIHFQALTSRDFAGGLATTYQRADIPAEMGPGDVLVVPGNPRILTIFPLILAARRRGMGVVWWGQAWSATSQPWRAGLRLAMMRRLADVWLLYTEVEAKSLAAKGFPAEGVFFTNNTIDERAIDVVIAAWDEERLRIFTETQDMANGKTILYCGRLTPKCKITLLLEAMPAVLGQVPEAQLVVIGDGELRGALERRADELGLGDKLRLLGALHGEEELAPWFLSSTCFAYPGAIGLSLNHAFGYGLPVVTHDNPHQQMPEFSALTAGENGLLFRQHDHLSLAETLAGLLADEQRCRTLGQNAYRTVRGPFSMERMVENFAAAIRAASRSAWQNVRA